MAWPAVAGDGRSWPEKVAKAPSPSNLEGASVVQKEKMEFWKRGFRERSYSSLERVVRGEEDGVVIGGQGGVGGGGDGGEVGGENGLFRWKKKEEDGVGGGVVVVGMEEEMEGKGGRPRMEARLCLWAAVGSVCCWRRKKE